MDLRRVLGLNLYDRLKKYSERRFGDRKMVVVIRLAVEEFLERVGG